MRTMQTTTLTRPANEAPVPDACFAFDVGDEQFVGVVREVVAIDRARADITVEMTNSEHRRMLAAGGS
jgi:hypothetical protein